MCASEWMQNNEKEMRGENEVALHSYKTKEERARATREGMKKGGVVERGGAVRREKRKRKSMRKRKRNKKRKKKMMGGWCGLLGSGSGFFFK